MRFSTPFRLLLLSPFASCLLMQAQVTGLSFRPVDARYSLALDRAIFISATPNQLHIYNPASQSDQVIALAETPLNLSLSPDGTKAAVAYTDGVAYVDLQAASVIQTYSGLAVGTGLVIFGSGYIYVFPSYQGNILSINLANAQVTTDNAAYESGGVFDPLDNAIYSTEDGLSPNNLYRFDASAGAISSFSGTQSPYFGVFGICGPLTLSHDGTTIYTGCGAVFRASADSTKDMRYLGVLPGLTKTQNMTTSDALHQIAAIPYVSTYSIPATPLADTAVTLFDSSSFNQVGQFATTPFQVNTNSYPAHGRWVFYNAASSAMFIVTQADSTAALELDYAIETVSLSNANSCAATFGASSASAVAPGGLATVQISAGEHCVFSASSNEPWIVLSSGSYGSGNTTLTYLVRPNLTAASRSGTITMGSQTFTVTQAPVGAASDQNPLSIKPVAADYDKALDKIVMVSAAPNELHIYDPLTQNDQIVPLGLEPLSVSVRPDGLFAAVGHRGKLSIVDLQGLTVSQVIPVDMDVAGILLAGNGYAYAFPSQTYSFTNMNSVQVSTGALTPLDDVYDGNIPRLYANGNYLYVAGGGASKLNISNGPATLVTGLLSTFDFTSNIWLSEDGNRLITSNGTAYFTSVVPSQDLAPDGSLSAATSVAWAANSQNQHETAVLLGDGNLGTGTNTQLQIYADNGLLLQSQKAMPSFSVGGTDYVSHGRYVFWNAAESKLFVLTEADSTSGLLSDYAEYTVEAPQSLPSCSYAVSPSTVYIGPSYSSFFVNVTSNCNWNPVIPANTWLYNYGFGANNVGNGQVTLTAQQNSGAARSTSFTIGNQTITVNQAASTCTYSLSPTTESLSQAGGSGSISLTTQSGCAWTIQSNASWLTVTSPQSGTGSATIQYSAAQNTTTNTYVYGSVTVAGSVSFTVTEITAPASPALSFIPVTPCRIADTRGATGPFGGPFISASSTRSLSIPSSSCNIPATAAAYSLNVTVVPHGPLSYLTVWPSGQLQPLVSTLNSDGRIKANAAIIPAGQSGAVSFYATNDTDLVLDINGYFVPYYSSNTALEFFPLPPCRIADTRNPDSALGGPFIKADQSRDFPILQSACSVPPVAQAYSLNYTAVPIQGLSYLSTWPSGQTQPVVSTINAQTGTVTANAAIVPAGANGDVNVFTSDNSHLVVDINGYFAGPGTGGLYFYAVTPCRLLDTRTGSGRSLNGSMTVPVAGYCDVPFNASAVVVNATVVPQTYLAYFSLWPNGVSLPLVSTLNAQDAAITSNMAIVPIGGNGAINAYSTDSTHLVLDVSGYFAP